MTILADASALVAILTREDNFGEFVETIEQHDERLYCATGAWEAIRAVARIRVLDVAEAGDAVGQWCRDLDFRLASIGEVETRLAVDAHRRYGKGTNHPAKLNMGDCFAYACAKANAAKLLYKGNDFVHTDLA